MANKISDTRYREAAHRLHHEEGVCEVDENAKISRGSDPGAYVQAWVWVYNADTKRKLTPDELTRWQTSGTKKVTRSSAGDSGRDWLERAVSRLQDEIQALPDGLQDEDYPALDAAIDTLNSILTGELKPTPERHKLALITDIIVNRYGEEDEPFSKKDLKQILDSIVEVMDAK